MFSILRPISWLGRYTGFAPYKIVQRQKTKRAEYEKVYSITWLILQSVLLIIMCKIYSDQVSTIKNKSLTVRSGWVFYTVTHLTHLTTNIFSDKIHKPKLVRLVNNLSRLEDRIKTYGVCVQYKKMRFVVPLFVLLSSTVAVLGFAGRVKHWIKFGDFSYKNFVDGISHLYAALILVAFVVHFVSFFRVFTSMIQSVNIYLEKSFLQNSDSNSRCATSGTLDMFSLFQAQTLLKVSKFHQLLNTLTKDFNEIVSVQLLALFLCDFCVQTVQGFSAANNIFNGKTMNLVLLLFSVSISCRVFIKLIILTSSVNSYLKQVTDV